MTKPKRAADQAKRFEEMAREVEADASAGEFDKLFAKIVPPKPRPAPAPKNKKPGR